MTSKDKSPIPPGLARIPPFPPVAARLLNLLAQPSVEIREIADLVSSDATFTASILQRVNSIEFGLMYPIANIRQAISTLGLDRTRQLVVTHATAAYMRGSLRTAELRTCWQHMVATAVLADQIAASAGEFKASAFTAGMMHDIGRLGLLVAYPKEYERIIRDAVERCLDLLDFETEEFGLHHSEAGRILAEKWGLPPDLRLVAGRHHDPCEGVELDLLRIVHVACRLADVLGYGMTKQLVPRSVDDIIAELPERVRARFDATPAQLCARIEERILQYDSDVVDSPPKAKPEDAAASTVDSPAVEEPEPESAAPLADDSKTNRTSAVIYAIIGAVLFLAAFLWQIQQ